MPWSVLGERVAGTSHLAGGTPCQDAFRFSQFGQANDWLLIAVADGAGSASQSEIGASLACAEFVRQADSLIVNGEFNRDGVINLFNTVRTRLITEAQHLQVNPRELACTSLLAVVGPDTATFAQIGDGAIVFSDGQEYHTAFWPEVAGYANETDFLTDEKFAAALRIDSKSIAVSEIAMFTDGLQRLALDYATRMPYPPFFKPLFEGLRDAPNQSLLSEPLQAFLNSPRVNGRTCDDKTLVLATRSL